MRQQLICKQPDEKLMVFVQRGDHLFQSLRSQKV